MKNIIKYIILFFTFSANAANVVINIPELKLDGRIELTSEPMRPYNPCSFFPSPIICSDDSLNIEITILYPITVEISNLGVMQTISLTMVATPEIAKEFKSFIIKKDNSIATFPETITSDGTINYEIEIKMDYMGLNSIPENASFFDINLTSN